MNATTHLGDWFAPVVPRTWQAEALPLVQAELRRGGGPLLYACTGAGKSVLVRALVSWACSAPRPGIVVVDVPTQALVRQLAATLDESPHLRGEVGQWYGARKSWGRVVVSCRASLDRLSEEISARGETVRLLVVDEAHLQPDRLERFVSDVNPARRLGVTATPYRSPPEESLALWDRIVLRYTLADGVRDGVLVPWVQVPHTGAAAEIDDACLAMIEAHRSAGPGIVDADTIEDAERFVGLLTDAGIRAKAIHSRLCHADRDGLRDRLEAGRLDCLVHVSTLVEGVDWPWLRWLCLRRRVGSRVRLVQQVGRGLRSAPGKSACLVLDPHDLLGSIGLSHPEAIGELEDAAADEVDDDKRERPKPEDGPVPMKRALWVIGRDPLESWVATCRSMADLAGLTEPPTVIDRSRRAESATRRQREALGQRLAKGRRTWLPDQLGLVCRALATAAADGGELTMGAAHDVLTMLGAAGKRAYEQHQRTGAWAVDWPVEVPPIPGGWEVKR